MLRNGMKLVKEGAREIANLCVCEGQEDIGEGLCCMEEGLQRILDGLGCFGLDCNCNVKKAICEITEGIEDIREGLCATENCNIRGGLCQIRDGLCEAEAGIRDLMKELRCARVC